MQKFRTLMLAIVTVCLVSGAAFAEKKNADQDKTNQKKAAASETVKLPASHTSTEIQQYCSIVGGRYSTTGVVGPDGKTLRGSAGYGCAVQGCGVGGCNYQIACETSRGECYRGPYRGPRGGAPEPTYPVRTSTGVGGLPSGGILDNGPGFNPQGPSSTGTPVAPPPPISN